MLYGKNKILQLNIHMNNYLLQVVYPCIQTPLQVHITKYTAWYNVTHVTHPPPPPYTQPHKNPKTPPLTPDPHPKQNTQNN